MDDEAPLKGVRDGGCSIRHAYPRASKQAWLILVLVAVLMAAGLTASMLRPAAAPLPTATAKVTRGPTPTPSQWSAA
ncbi:hypothetical protein [Microbacterium sp. LWO13-1.2]|uniref:hypothetical protein n=1 Tax=Microbacterium sp. LWO13-1.2 TaxID=3135262 RepID=UPI00313A3511